MAGRTSILVSRAGLPPEIAPRLAAAAAEPPAMDGEQMVDLSTGSDLPPAAAPQAQPPAAAAAAVVVDPASASRDELDAHWRGGLA